MGRDYIDKFYCFEEELRKLNARYGEDNFECFFIYGRRRVGKTALINENCKDKPTIFFDSEYNCTGKSGVSVKSAHEF